MKRHTIYGSQMLAERGEPPAAPGLAHRHRPPRALRRVRLPVRAQGRRHRARGPHRLRGRRVRRLGLQARLQELLDRGGRAHLHLCARSASSAPARWRPASSRSSPRPATRSPSSPAPRQGRQAVQTALGKSLEKAVQRGKLDEADARRRPRPGHRHDALDDLADVDLVVEAIVEDLVGQAGAVREPRRDLQARRRARHDDLLPAGHRVRRGHRRARPTSSACTSSTRRRS